MVGAALSLWWKRSLSGGSVLSLGCLSSSLSVEVTVFKVKGLEFRAKLKVKGLSELKSEFQSEFKWEFRTNSEVKA